MPLELHKYNAAGVLQWTFNTPYDTTMWLGSFATDDLGNSYVTNGSTAQIIKVNTGGAVVWNNTSPGGLFSSTELWNIAFNCDQTKLVVGGTGGILPPLPYIYDIDMNTGNVITSVQVTSGQLIPTQEVRAITATENEKYYFLTHDSIGYIDQGLTTCPGSSMPFHVDNSYGLGYKCEDWRYNNSGIEALAYYDGYVYVNRGDEIHKRDMNSAAIVATAPIPGGVFNNVFLGGNEVQNSGIDIDDCGNIFVGSKTGVIQFNTNLVQQGSFPTSFIVYDIDVSTSGDVVAAGSTGSSSSNNRTGSVQSFALGACSQLATTCCNPSICTQPNLCTTDPPVTLSPYTSGGTWTPSTGLNTSTGVFDPSVAGPGTHTLYYSLACGMDSVTIIVSNCTLMTICVEANGDLTVTGGTGPYQWDGGSMQPSCVPGLGFCNAPFTANGPMVLTWSNFANGPATVNPPAPPTDTIRVVDAFGDTVYVYGLGTLPPCSAVPCDATINPAGPFCIGDPAINLTAANTGGTWSGTGITNTTNGTFDPTTAGVGNHTITYTLPTCNDTIIIVVNPKDTAAFTYPSGSYCLTDPDPLPTITGTTGGTFSIDNSGVINSSTGLIDLSASGLGNYVVTYITNGTCPDTATFNISITSSANATITQAGPFCENDPSVTLTAVDPGGNWTGTGITNATNGTFDPATAGAGNHVITYTITGSCGDVDTMTITVIPKDTAAFTYPSGSYCLTDPDPLPTITGTTGGTFSIDNSGVINSSTGLIDLSASGLGNYVVTYITNGTCPDTATFNIAITNSTDATITQAGPFCENDPSVTLTAVDPGGNWTGTGITNATNGTFDPATAGAGNHVITYTITGSCGDVDTMTITVIPKDTAAFTYPSGSYCLTDPDPLPTITGTTGGTFSIDNSGVINSSTGLIDLSASGLGNYVVTYITNGTCPDTATFNISITSSANATITQAGPFCENDPSVTLTAVDPGGNWTGTGITNATNGTFDPATAGAGNHVITYTIAGSCGDVDTMTIVVNPADDASFSFSPATFCDTDPNPLPTGIVTTGGTFSIDNGGTINGATGEVNLSASGAGSYVVTYITNGSCPDTVNFNITITTCATPTASYTVSDSTICDGECVTFTDNSTGATAWQWTFNGGTPASANTQGPHTVCFTGPGTYNIELIASNSAGADTTTSTVEVFANPTIDAGSDVTIDLGQSVTLNATGSNGTYSWTPPTWLDCPTCSTTTSTPEETITYTVVVVDSNGCTASDEVTIIVDFDYVIWVPNIFSPNGDGSNDVVFVRGVGVESFNFVIYDRWGEKVFETSDLNNGWDGTFRGKKMNNAVFVYYLEATFNNGQEVTKKGDITLIR